MKQVPYAAGLPVFGQLFPFQRDFLGFFKSMARDYGDLVHYRLLHVPAYQVNRPDYIQEVLVAQADKFEKGKLDHDVFKTSLGNGLLISEGDFHSRQRRLMQPAFHSKRIVAYADVMIDKTEQMLEDWRDGQTVDIHEAMSTLTRRVVLKTLFDVEESGDMSAIASAMETINHLSNDGYKRNFVYPEWLPIPPVLRQRRAVAELDKLILGIIEQRRKSREDRGDLLSMLLLAQDEDDGTGMTDQQVRNEAVTLFAAGHETTANALTWTFYLLAQHPEVEAKLLEELDRVLGGRRPTFPDLAQLTYTDQIIKESMRIYPPVWILNGRRPLQDVVIDGYTLPKDTVIFISPYVLHHDPRYFPEPETFNPERWANDFEKSLPRYAYFPFGGGPRVCIGNSFALMEARLVLATAMQHFRMEFVEAVEPLPLVTLRPRGEIRLRVKERSLELAL